MNDDETGSASGDVAFDVVTLLPGFTSLAMVYRLYDSTSVRIPYRAPMLRAIPVHRPTLALGVRELSL